MSNIENQQFFDENLVSDEIPAWKRLDTVIRSWIVLSGWEKDLNDYQNRKYLYQD